MGLGRKIARVCRQLMADQRGSTVASYAVLIFVIGTAIGAAGASAGISLRDLLSAQATAIENSLSSSSPAAGPTDGLAGGSN